MVGSNARGRTACPSALASLCCAHQEMMRKAEAPMQQVGSKKHLPAFWTIRKHTPLPHHCTPSASVAIGRRCVGRAPTPRHGAVLGQHRDGAQQQKPPRFARRSRIRQRGVDVVGSPKADHAITRIHIVICPAPPSEPNILRAEERSYSHSSNILILTPSSIQIF